MKRTFYVIQAPYSFMDADGSEDHPCYGIFPARDTAEDVMDYYATIGLECELIEEVAESRKA